MRRALLGVALALTLGPAQADPPFQTPLEFNNWSRYSRTAEISTFLAILDQHSTATYLETIGRSAGGRPLEVLWIAGSPLSPPSARLTVVLVGSQHGTEPSGGEALAELARELVMGSLRSMTRHADFALMPNANPDGRDLRKRVNANGVNLSTDFIVLSQPETRALNDFLLRVKPEVILDMHESALMKKSTLGREGYLTDFEAQIEFANNPNVNAALLALSREQILPEVVRRTNQAGLRAARYIGEITSIHQPITNGGLTLRNLRNKAGLMGMLSFLIENRLDPPSKAHRSHRNIRERTRKQVVSARAFLETTLAHRAALMRLAHARGEPREAQQLHVGYQKNPAHQDIVVPLRRLRDGVLEQRRFADHRSVQSCVTLPMPQAYVIRGGAAAVGEVLARHRIAYRQIEKPGSVLAVAQTPSRSMTEPVPGCGDHGVHEAVVRLSMRRGDLWIETAQEQASLLPLILDLRSTSSLFRQPGFDQLAIPGEKFFVYRVNRNPRSAEKSSPRRAGLRY